MNTRDKYALLGARQRLSELRTEMAELVKEFGELLPELQTAHEADVTPAKRGPGRPPKSRAAKAEQTVKAMWRERENGKPAKAAKRKPYSKAYKAKQGASMKKRWQPGGDLWMAQQAKWAKEGDTDAAARAAKFAGKAKRTADKAATAKVIKTGKAALAAAHRARLSPELFPLAYRPYTTFGNTGRANLQRAQRGLPPVELVRRRPGVDNERFTRQLAEWMEKNGWVPADVLKGKIPAVIAAKVARYAAREATAQAKALAKAAKKTPGRTTYETEVTETEVVKTRQPMSAEGRANISAGRLNSARMRMQMPTIEQFPALEGETLQETHTRWLASSVPVQPAASEGEPTE